MITVSIRKRIKTFDGSRQLEVNTSFSENSVTSVCGPSGAGKTTFLKIIAGLTEPDYGLIKVDDETWLDTTRGVNLSPQRRRAGFVFQDYALFPNMTVRQHLDYATRDASLINKLLSIGKMEGLLRHKPEHLSGGQQQRLALLRAIATEPRVLLMDEPFSALDQELRSVLIDDLKNLLDETKVTCLIVTHNPGELVKLSSGTLRIDGSGI